MADEPMLSEDQIRTMRGDLNQTGTPANEPSLSIPSKPVFDADEPAFSPNTSNQMPSSVDDLIAQGGGGSKKLWWIIGGVIAAIVLGLIGYFTIYGLFSSSPAEVPVETDAPTVPAQPATPAQPVEPLQPTTPAKTNNFINEPDGRGSATLPSAIGHNDIVKVLAAQAIAARNGMTAVSLTTDGSPVKFSNYFAALATGFTSTAKTEQLFTEDFTTFIYKDQNGSWPGYVLTLKTGFVPDDLRAWFTSLEKTNGSNFFMVSPGKMEAFKDGIVNEKYPDRYAAGSTPGASLGYLMLPQQNKVIISSSFAGMKEALRLMGL